MRIFTAAIVTETNTFSPIPTGWQAFAQHGIQHGRDSTIQPTSEFATMVRWREMAHTDGHAIVESIAAAAEPAGVTLRAVYESLRDEMLEDLQRAMPVDVVLLYLHGAMVAAGYDDCEGDILARVRGIAGEAVIAAELDLHAHLTPQMLSSATLLLAYNEYPHTDIVARGEELYRLSIAAARGEVQPVMATFDCKMNGIFPTQTAEMRSLLGEMRAAERGTVLSLSLIHGFPWGDVEHAGAKCLAITDGDADLARSTARRFGLAFWRIRERALIRGYSIDAALDAALASTRKPVVLADAGDNAGGGAPGDSTYVLKRMLERNITNAVSGVYYDPGAVEICFDAGEGSVIDLRCGGKLGAASGMPLDLHVTVRKLRERHTQDSMDDSQPVSLGRAAWVETAGIHLVLASIRSQVFAPNAFTDLGIRLDQAQIIVVKSSHHFWGKFAPIAAQLFHMSTPGALRLDFENIDCKKRDPNYWPRIASPFPSSS